MEKAYILPLGTVVRLKEGSLPIMIVGRAPLYEDNGKMGYCDYAAVFYPQGLVDSSQFLFFNHEDIEEIIFEGYRSEEEVAFAEAYEENIQKAAYPKIQADEK